MLLIKRAPIWHFHYRIEPQGHGKYTRCYQSSLHLVKKVLAIFYGRTSHIIQKHLNQSLAQNSVADKKPTLVPRKSQPHERNWSSVPSLAMRLNVPTFAAIYSFGLIMAGCKFASVQHMLKRHPSGDQSNGHRCPEYINSLYHSLNVNSDLGKVVCRTLLAHWTAHAPIKKAASRAPHQCLPDFPWYPENICQPVLRPRAAQCFRT